MIDNIYPKYIEAGPRRCGKSTRLLEAVAEFNSYGLRNVQPIVLAPNRSMLHHLRQTYHRDDSYFTTASRVDNSTSFMTVDDLMNMYPYTRSFHELVLFVDEAALMDQDYPGWITYRTLYAASTPTGSSESGNLLNNLIVLNRGNRYVYRSNVR